MMRDRKADVLLNDALHLYTETEQEIPEILLRWFASLITQEQVDIIVAMKREGWLYYEV